MICARLMVCEIYNPEWGRDYIFRKCREFDRVNPYMSIICKESILAICDHFVGLLEALLGVGASNGGILSRNRSLTANLKRRAYYTSAHK